jgi:hypothetical protein
MSSKIVFSSKPAADGMAEASCRVLLQSENESGSSSRHTGLLVMSLGWLGQALHMEALNAQLTMVL